MKSSLVDEKFHGARHWAKLAFPIWGFQWCTLTHFWGDVSCGRWKKNRRFCTPPLEHPPNGIFDVSLFHSSKNTKKDMWIIGSQNPHYKFVVPTSSENPKNATHATRRYLGSFGFNFLLLKPFCWGRVDVWFHVIKRHSPSVFDVYFRNLFRVALPCWFLSLVVTLFAALVFQLNNQVLFQYVYLQAGAMAPLSLMWWYLNPLIIIKPGTFSTNMLLTKK